MTRKSGKLCQMFKTSIYVKIYQNSEKKYQKCKKSSKICQKSSKIFEKFENKAKCIKYPKNLKFVLKCQNQTIYAPKP